MAETKRVTERPSYVYYLDWAEETLKFPDDLRLKIDDAIKRYVLYGEEPTDRAVVYSIFGLMRKQIDKDAERYNKKCEKNRENQLKRWEKQRNGNGIKNTSEYDRIQMNTNYTDNDNDNDNDYIESRENAHERLMGVFFDRPITTESFLKRWETTPEELRRVCQEVIDDWIAINDPHLESEEDDAKRHFLNAVRKKYEILKTKANESRSSYQPKSGRVRPKRTEEPGYGLVD